MELSRSDFQILNVLKEHQCTNYQESMTLQEIIPELPFSRVTAYKRLKNLCDIVIWDWMLASRSLKHLILKTAQRCFLRLMMLKISVHIT